MRHHNMLWSAPRRRRRDMGLSGALRGRFMRDPASELRRIPLLRTWVHKDHQARLRLLVDEEHTLANPVRCGGDAGIVIQILWSTLFEDLVCGGKFVGRELFTSAGCHDDAHSASSSSTNQPIFNCG